jgi:hypothetical protein
MEGGYPATLRLTRATALDAWVDREPGGSFPDRRLRERLGKILGDLGRLVGGTVPAACQDWAATKAADRFFSNPSVDEGRALGDAQALAGLPQEVGGRQPCCTTVAPSPRSAPSWTRAHPRALWPQRLR